MAAISKIIGAGLILLLIGTVSPAQKPSAPLSTQKRSDLEKERAALQDEITNVQRSLKETHQHRRQSMDNLALLQHKLADREAAIRKADAEVRIINHEMDRSGQETLRLQHRLDSLRNFYAREIISGYKDRNRFDYLSFIFSASGFNDALMRVQYLRTYKEYNTERATHMRQEVKELQDKVNELKAAQLEKESVLKEENKERMVLGAEKKKKSAAVVRLQWREKELEGQIAARQRQNRKLAMALAAVVTSAKPAYKGLPALDNKAGLRVSATFEKSKGHLPWPVASRNIALAFGLHVYPNGIVGNNLGLTLSAMEDSPVKAVYDGEVQAVMIIEDVRALIIRHGNYYTTYSNLSETNVMKGESVKMGQIIGHVGAIGQLDFFITDEKTRWLDPAKWLAPKKF